MDAVIARYKQLLLPVIRLSLLLSLLFTLFIGLIHARPHDEPALRQFLIPPDDCPAPCWEGIRPGVSTVDEALYILRNHPWVRDIEAGSGESYLIHWNGSQPAFIDATQPGILSVQEAVVMRIRLPARVSFADVWLAFDAPSQGSYLCHRRVWPRPVVHFAAYPETGFVVRMPLDAPTSCRETFVPAIPCVFGQVQSFWSQDAEIIIGNVFARFRDYSDVRAMRSEFCIEPS
ncbi:MAG: hypothetical protein D6737_09655 [Chloroflexi bacterium]|nr:MAG: hypothetical protein D6737_09655 [Chloroflexota bacterium]